MHHCVTRHAAWLIGLSTAGLLISTTALSQAPLVAEAENNLLEEVIVTARKIEESVQDIPMSVQVLSRGFLENADVTRLFELQFNIPGLVVNDVGMFGAGFSLRGIADQIGTSLSVATHLNGVYLGTSNLAIARMFDLERVEVLKGPQGTLYGRNSTGGSINFITRAPQDEFSAHVETAYGSFNTARAEGYINVPFEASALRLAFIGSEGDGYISNSVDDRKFAESDFWGLRGSLLISATDKLRVDIMAQHVRDDGASGELWGPRPDFLPDPDDIWLTTVTLSNPFLITENDTVSVNLQYDLGYAQLHSITGYARSKVNGLDDCAGSPILEGCTRGVDPLDYDQWSEEIQLISNGDASFNWLVGANFFSNQESEEFFLSVPFFPPVPQNDATATAEDVAYAAFGQASWQMAPRWSINGGLRLSHEKNRVSSVGTGAEDHPTLTVAEDDWSHVSWRLDLEHDYNENVLLYAGVSTGFKSGGVTTDLLPDGEFDTFGPENLTAVETGIKFQSAERGLTVNASAFYYDFTDLQVTTVVFTDEGLVSEIDNAAKAEVYGMDVAGAFAVSDSLTLSGGVVWLPKREYVEFQNDLTGDTLSGNDIIRAPEWSGTAAIEYELPWGGRGTYSTRLEYNYRSQIFFSKENSPIFEQGGFGLLNVFLRFEANSRKWYVFAAGRNLTDEQYFNAVLIQSAPGYPANYEVGFGLRY
jgi:iron complex outermembrane receptor protein